MPIRYAVMGGYVLKNKKSTFVCYKECAELWGLEEGEYLAILFPEEVEALEKAIILLSPDPTGQYNLGELGGV
jgi:hypothetical protein